MFNVWGGELLILMILIVIILGPTKLPEYAAKLRDATIWVRDLARGASSQLRTEMGPAFDEVDWQQLDPRQYDPRRIVRDALATPGGEGAGSPQSGAGVDAGAPGSIPAHQQDDRARRTIVPTLDPQRPTPFDHEAT